MLVSHSNHNAATTHSSFNVPPTSLVARTMRPAIHDPEKGPARIRPHSQGWSRYYYRIPRIIRLLLFTIVTFFLVQRILRHIQNKTDYSLKLVPTDFSALAGPGSAALLSPAKPIRQLNGTHIDDRYIYMRELGKGMQGSAALYVDVSTGEVVVVKTYNSDGRNHLPAQLADDFARYSSSWPSEIEAGLLLGSPKISESSVYVPVKDYFILQSNRSDRSWAWAMVTPFIEDGTLKNLAEVTKIHERTPQKLDMIFRPVLNTVLEGLDPLHAAGYCHNDIKPDNVFVAATKHWLLGDLGAVREIEHPWHMTRRIKRENQWADCKTNDVRRALKTYLWFIRQASGDPSAFDLAFYAEQQAWSKLYWEFMRQPVSIERTLDMSAQLDSAYEREWTSTRGASHEGSACLQRAIDLELTCTTLHTRLDDWWPFRRC